ncbi:MAG TPA: glycoside hydrolase family 2 TIM barrel-domain containing protein [Chitinophagaceae bacterium]|jgi:hypothetical protein
MAKASTVITLFIFFSVIHISPLFSQSAAVYTTIRYNLSGTDKDHTVNWDFFCTKGRKSGAWTQIAVPSCWEQQGFGAYNYGHDKIKADEEGLYKHVFNGQAAWKNKKIWIVFEGSMTDTEVKINGVSAGDVHQGAFYRFKYDITSLVKVNDSNTLEVKVGKMSANASVNRAERSGDFWVFGGIFRPVYLEIVPGCFIDRVAVAARADGNLRLDVYAAGDASKATSVMVQVQQLNGTNIGRPLVAAMPPSGSRIPVAGRIAGIKAWNPEYPALYNMVVSLLDANGRICHQVKQRFGFRTVEVRKKDGVYVNGRKIIMKGITHHSEWPETGRTLSRDIDLLDVGLIKEMNMNAVRMSHYPPDQSFLDVCDSLGLFVLDELTGWQAKYDTTVGAKLVKELVVRDVNHPSVILWDNGNEGGWNRALDSLYAVYDPQRRTVIHPWERFNGFDTKHYPVYNYVVNSSLYDDDIFLPTEFMHGLYDGGLGAGLDDFWSAMLRKPTTAGGFMWAFLDEAVARTDKDGWLDTDGNHAPDGIVGPHREKEGSFYTVKEIWSPVYVGNKKLTAGFDGRLFVENRYIYTNLSQCCFEWKLVRLPRPWDNKAVGKTDARGNCSKVNIPPGEQGFVPLSLPASWRSSDVLYVTAFDPYGKEIFTWSWPLTSAKQLSQTLVLRDKTPKAIGVEEGKGALVVKTNEAAYYFDKATGGLRQVLAGQKQFALSNGPFQAGVPHILRELKHYTAGKDYIVEPVYETDSFRVKWIFSPGLPAKLEYSYCQKNDADFTGIVFSYPEDSITGMTWLGNGPYRVWKNRLKGGRFNVWHKDYNNTVTGESWLYPEFKGYHSNMYWVKVQQGADAFTVYTESDNIFLQMLAPKAPVGAGNSNTSPAFPGEMIGFMNSIPAIGTKFKPASDMGPQSQRNTMLNYTPVSGTLWFDFR